jgi:hypothetical protein
MSDDTQTDEQTYSAPFEITPLYHVPRSQVWEGSRGAQRGHVHLHVSRGPTRFTAANGRSITRGGGVALCRRNGWYERAPEGETASDLCPRCKDVAERYGVEMPEGFRS